MGKLQQIDSVCEPAVGVRYLVPMVDGEYNGKRAWWPVLGPKHEDAEFINFPHQHYHIDPRFLSKAQVRFLGMSEESGTLYAPKRKIYSQNVFASPLHENTTPGLKRRIHSGVEHRARMMLRQMPSYPRYNARWLPTLEDAYADVKLKPGMVCPHRGAPLRGLTPDADGCVTCPLHGLRWNVTTGCLVRSAPTRA
jgi:hypothetical protein